jgi:hypothetical protein
MANTATAGSSLAIRLGQADNEPVIPYKISIDTTDTLLTVHSPTSPNKQVGLVGIIFSETAATNLTLVSGSDEQVIIELGTNQGAWHNIGGLKFCTSSGQPLRIKSSVPITSMLLFVVESHYFNA